MNPTIQTVDWNRELVELYNRHSDILFRESPGFMNETRKRGIEQFIKLGLPVKSSENYRYLNLDHLFRHDFQDYFLQEKIPLDIDHIFHCDIPTLDTHVLFLLNGFLFNAADRISELPSGVVVGSLHQAAKDFTSLVESHYGRYASMEEEGLVALNSAFARDGIFVNIPDGVVLERPIQIVNLLRSGTNLRVQHRNLFVIGRNAEARIIVCDHTLSEHRFLTNSVTEVFTGENARLDFIKVQNEHNFASNLSHLFQHQEKGSRVHTKVITLHGGMVRNNIRVTLNAEDCTNSVSGLYLMDKGQHVDTYTYIDHAKPNCTSSQLFKGVLDDFATGAFTGRILVRPDAQKTEAFQANNNILLTDDAKMNTRPQLEIYADDVKCSHGATVGQLDEDALFYLRSRGIEEREARLMLMFAFVNEIIARIEVEPLRNRISKLVEKRLRGELSRCQNCAMDCG